MGYGLWFVVVVLHRKIRLTQLWVELGCGKYQEAAHTGRPVQVSIYRQDAFKDFYLFT